VSCEEHIVSKDKYPSIFSRSNSCYDVCYPLRIFRNKWGLKIGGYLSDIPSFSWGIFSHMVHLDQLCANETILWIIHFSCEYHKKFIDLLLSLFGGGQFCKLRAASLFLQASKESRQNVQKRP